MSTPITTPDMVTGGTTGTPSEKMKRRHQYRPIVSIAPPIGYFARYGVSGCRAAPVKPCDTPDWWPARRRSRRGED
ncbi:hypothetical protein GCM10011576_01170 [Micromonospora parathelypteridis]|nr:hypothetical protein GCM10011576_01170 [Micromonospora parathelypteridis]